MANIYLRWKNPDCNGKAIEWEEMSGKAFFAFLNSNSSEGRYFIKLNNDICFDANVVFIEATKAQYAVRYYGTGFAGVLQYQAGRRVVCLHNEKAQCNLAWCLGGSI